MTGPNDKSTSSPTRDRVLKAALKLFNENSYSRVTTHEIAAAADMSPGNLYYHFANKEEIVKEIFARMEIFSEDMWQERGPRNPRQSFVDFIRFFFGNLERYRFFFREFPLIVGSVPAMRQLWSFRWNALAGEMRRTLGLWVDAGILKKFENDAAEEAFIESCWVLMNFSSVHLELGSAKPGAAKKEKALELVLRFLHPYHTPKGQRALALYLGA